MSLISYLTSGRSFGVLSTAFTAIALLGTIAISAPSTVSSQALPAGAGGLVLSASPANPSPGQEVIIRANSFVIDINSADITWAVDGRIVRTGSGLTTLSVTAPELGKQMQIAVSAVTPGGVSVVGSYIITSGSIDFVIENTGYAHPLFKGKIQPTYQSTLRITAIPHIGNGSGGEYDPKTLVYQWKRNDKVLQAQSGYGKQTLTLTGDIVPRPYEISVSAYPSNGGYEVSGSRFVEEIRPSIAFYVDDPLYGPLFNRAISSTLRIGTEKETSVLAVPFGFTKPLDSLGQLAMTWLINNIKHDELSLSDSVVLRAPEGVAGTSNIRLDIKNPSRILQGATASFIASFDTAAASAISSGPAF